MTRAALHRLLDELPEAQVDQIADLLEAVRRNDGMAIQLALAPEESATEDEREVLAELDAEPECERHSFEDVLTHFELTPDQLL